MQLAAHALAEIELAGLGDAETLEPPVSLSALIVTDQSTARYAVLDASGSLVGITDRSASRFTAEDSS